MNSPEFTLPLSALENHYTHNQLKRVAPTTKTSPQQHSLSPSPEHDTLVNQYYDDGDNNNNNIENDNDHDIAISNESLESSSTDINTNTTLEKRGSTSSRVERHVKKSQIVIRKFQKLDQSVLNSTPAPDVKIGQRVAYKEYYGNEFGTIRWIGRVPQICPDWTVGVEFDNAIGEGDGSLNGRRYFIAKDCFAKFLALNDVALVDQHVGRPEPGTMISVMSAAVRPGQMISIQRVSTVHVQHCFLNAPHQIPSADILAVNTRLHCQCPNCGPCAHVIKPPRTQRLAHAGKNATHMCQFSTYTCCGMEGQEETMCTYTGNKVVSLPPPICSSTAGLPPVGNSWIDGSGYLTNLQTHQSKLMPKEYRLGAAPEDIENHGSRRNLSKLSSSRQGSGRHNHKHNKHNRFTHQQFSNMHDTIQYPENFTNGTNTSTTATTATTDFSGKNAHIADNSDYPNVSSQADKIQYSPPAQYTPSPDLSNHQFTVACQDKLLPEESDGFDDSNKIISKSKTLYRDSIENRYLFPTDDPIDSTLEADLESLSQARYGHYTNHSRLNGSRNIFKSLRSLVSCLNVQSNHSGLERPSENTLKYPKHRVESTNKSMPTIASTKPNEFCVQFNSMCEKCDDNCHYNTHGSSAAPNDQKQSNTDQVIKRHISSSSDDCGFSSASQNSINFHSNNSVCSLLMPADDVRKTKQIYKRILAKLMSSKSVTNEDLKRLRKILYELHFENCCLHINNNNNNDSTKHTSLNSTFNTAEPDQIIADIIKKSYLYQDVGHDSLQSASSACCHATNYCLYNSSDFEMDKIEEKYTLPERRYTKMKEGCEIAQTPSSRKENCQVGSSTSESISSYDSFAGTAVIGDNQSDSAYVDGTKRNTIKLDDNSVDNADLPKAFELKLTLSINSDQKSKKATKTTQISIGDPCKLVDNVSSVSEDINGSRNLVNSTFNLNVTSARKEGEEKQVKDFSDSSEKVVLP